VQPRREQARVIFARAIERGEIPANTDVEIALDLLTAPSITGSCTATRSSPIASLARSWTT
jgi:tetracycline repressor-like protein